MRNLFYQQYRQRPRYGTAPAQAGFSEKAAPWTSLPQPVHGACSRRPAIDRRAVAAPTRASTPARRSHARSSGLFGEGRLVDKFSAARSRGVFPSPGDQSRAIHRRAKPCALARASLPRPGPLDANPRAGPAQPAALTATLVINELHYHAASDAYARSMSSCTTQAAPRWI
jgi:hypothetical protein